MLIHDYKDATYIAALASCLRTHAKSFEQWFLLYGVYNGLSPQQWEAERGSKMTEMKRYFDGVPVDVFFTEQPGVVLLSRDLNPQSLANIARLLGLEVRVLCELGAQATQVLPLLEQQIHAEDPWFPELPIPAEALSDYVAQPIPLSQLAVDIRDARSVPHVLLVEDDPIAQRIVRRTISEMGEVVIHTAANAEEAVEAYITHAPDLVFMDIGLPTASGFDVLRSLVSTDSRAYVVMLSGHHEFECLYHALYQGAKGYVAKPFREEQLSYYFRDCMLQRHSA